MDSFIDLLVAFGFRELKEWIVIISSIMFLLNLFGGMIAAIFVVNSKALKPPKLTSRMSFRMFILSEAMMVMAAFYYHALMIESISGAHVVYWVAAMMMMPLLGIIGSQTMYLILSGKIRAKKREAREKARKIRENRTTTMEEGHARVSGKAKK